MTALLPNPESVYLDNNGVPLTGGKIWTYVPSTLVLKTTWQDAGQVVANTNPIILDSAGRAIIYGTGLYRFRVLDALDNLIYDENTAASLAEDAISTVMLPVTSAATLATARSLMGIDAAIDYAVSHVTSVTGSTGPTGGQGPTGPTGPAGSSAGDYAPVLVTSNPGYAKFQNANGTASNIFVQWGFAVTDGSGNVNVTFATPFPSTCFMVTATASATSWWANIASFTTTGFSATTSSPLHGGGWPGSMGFSWMAIGT